MMGRLVAHHVENGRLRAPRIVQIGKSIAQAWPAMQQCDRRLLRHPPVAIGRAGRDALEQAEHAMHAWHAIERRDEMHLAGAGIGEAGVDARCEQRADQGFSAVQCRIPCLWDCSGK